MPSDYFIKIFLLLHLRQLKKWMKKNLYLFSVVFPINLRSVYGLHVPHFIASVSYSLRLALVWSWPGLNPSKSCPVSVLIHSVLGHDLVLFWVVLTTTLLSQTQQFIDYSRKKNPQIKSIMRSSLAAAWHTCTLLISHFSLHCFTSTLWVKLLSAEWHTPPNPHGLLLAFSSLVTSN